MAVMVSDGSTRRDIVVEAATKQFAKHGYDATTMRDIASVTGILPGSLYYHFSSKEELFAAVHERAINYICTGVVRAINPSADPWTRLEEAAKGYLEAMLNNNMYASLIVTEFPRRRSRKLRDRLISDRDRFEKLFVEIIEDLPLEQGVDRKYWRLALLGMLAWTYVWYRPTGDPPGMVAQRLLNLIKNRTVRTQGF
jgi:TetR/AcrR family transcriptional regulator, cholesterol catabolism regulator